MSEQEEPISQDEFVKQIKRLIRLINYGAGHLDDQYEALRDLQRRYVRHLVDVATTGANSGRVLVKIPRTVLRLLRMKDFPAGIVVSVSKYRVYCYDRRSSSVYGAYDLRDLHFRQLPMYLKDFLR